MRPTLLPQAVRLSLAVAALFVASPALSQEVPDADADAGVWPPHTKKTKKRDEAPAAEVAPAPEVGTVQRGPAPPLVVPLADGVGPPADAPAEEPPPEGIWHWVGQMEGEIPTPEQVEAMEEVAERDAMERTLTDDLSADPIPTTFYTDPVRSLRPDPLYLDRVDPSEFDIPVEVNPWVEKWVRYFTTDGRKHYARWLSRSTSVRPYMYEQLEKAGLPRDLVYLSMIESGYNAQAYSHAGAAGMWQFIESTGKLYKLRVDYWVDERRDIEESTRAAIDLLADLHEMFDGNWYFAWAAYNGGPGRIRKASQSAGTQNFWTIADGAYLHTETDNYIPKIIAAAIIGHHPERYGFTDIEYQPAVEYDVAHVSGTVELDTLARCSGTTVERLRELNPSLRRFSTPPEGFDLKIPAGTQQQFVAALAEAPREVRSTTAVARHTVRRGETLSTIANKYNVGVTELSRANDLRNVNKIYVGMSLVIPGHGETVAEATPAERKAPEPSTPPKATTPKTQARYHTVVRGDTLSEIATRYGASVTQVKSWNGLSGSTIVPGQKLAVNSAASGGKGSTSSTASSGSGTSTAASKYTVRKGDTLSTIASRYGVSTSDLQKWNGISNPSSIYAGQVLVVKGGSASSGGSSSSGWTSYTVKSGDSLGAIASRYHCSVTELKSWNGLKSTVIQPGQKLKIKS